MMRGRVGGRGRLFAKEGGVFFHTHRDIEGGWGELGDGGVDDRGNM